MLPLLLLGGDNGLPIGFVGRYCARLPNAEGSWLLSMVRASRNFTESFVYIKNRVGCAMDLPFANYW